MAGFEGPREPGAGGEGSPKLPSWAVTRSSPEPIDVTAADPAARDTFADLGPALPVDRGAVRSDPPVVQVPEHPFDVEDPFGDNQLGGASTPWIRPPADDSEVRVVDLADEFHLTTAQALEVCAASGTPAASGAAWLTVEQAEAFRAAVATYDRTEVSAEEFPAWAVPPGGRRRPPAAGSDDDAVVPGAALLARTRPAPDDDEPDEPSGRMRVVLLVVAVLVIIVLVAMRLLG
jgi:hypothetical protein